METENVLDQEINLDSLTAYLRVKFPDRRHSEAVSELLSELRDSGYTSLLNLDNKLKETLKQALESEKTKPPRNRETHKPVKFADVGIVREALTLGDPKYLKVYNKKFH